MERIILSLIISLFLFLFAVEVVSSAFGHPLCSSHDSLALLQFRNSLDVGIFIDEHCESSYPKTPSWNSSIDCCRWDGVTCDIFSGHVIGLDLRCSRLEGTIHPNTSLFQLRQLQTLDLSHNFFGNSPFPQGIGQLVGLTHLNLSYCSLQGRIPSEISHLSNLVSLELSYYVGFDVQFSWEGFNMLFQNLTKLEVLSLSHVNVASSIPMNVSFSTSLRYLDLGDTDLHGDLPKSIFLLPNLETLRLSDNWDLTVSFPKFNWSSSHSLRELDLSITNISRGLPNSIGSSFKALKFLRLSRCNLAGPFPEFIRNLSQITQLDLSNNHLEGKISDDAFSNLKKLTFLSLQNNAFTGRFPSSLVNLTKLEDLSLGSNSLRGPLPEFKTNSLQRLDLSYNQFYGPIPQSLRDLRNLTALALGHNNLSGEVGTETFSSVKNLTSLDLSHSGLSWNSNKDHNINTTFPLLNYLGLGSCRVKDFPDFLLNSKGLVFLDLSENDIHGQFPKWFGGFSALRSLNLSHNYLTSLDHIPWVDGMNLLDLQSNKLTGPLPSSLCRSSGLYLINLSYNNLSAEIPSCLFTLAGLEVLELRANNFQGPIPNKFPKDSWVTHISLSKNKLEGPIPRSLVNCTFLEVLDLGNNNIRDTFPTWLEMLHELEILILKSNRFYGPIDGFQTKSPFPNLRIFDLSGNSFTGSLPTEVLTGFKAMMNMDAHKSGLEYYFEETVYFGSDQDEVSSRGWYAESMTLVVKNQETKFNKILKIFTTIDLSRNKFEGEIPKLIGNLNSLLLLNLSHNSLTGHIPAEMKNMRTLEALDLSFNQLTGKIPVELASITFLAVLNLSHNHLVGPIPHSNQFNTFPNDSYFGNSELCGFPLSNECGQDKSASEPVSLVEQEEDEPSFLSQMTWQSVLIGYGCGLTFGFTILYLIYRFERPRWFIDFLETITHEMIYRVQRGRKRGGNFRRRRR